MSITSHTTHDNLLAPKIHSVRQVSCSNLSRLEFQWLHLHWEVSREAVELKKKVNFKGTRVSVAVLNWITLFIQAMFIRSLAICIRSVQYNSTVVTSQLRAHCIISCINWLISTSGSTKIWEIVYMLVNGKRVWISESTNGWW